MKNLKTDQTTDTEEINGFASETDKQRSFLQKMQTTVKEAITGLFNTSKKAEQNHKLIEQIEVENTPFRVIRIDDKWFVSMGKYRLTHPLKTKDEAMVSALDESWWRIIQVQNIQIENHEIIIKLQKEVEELKKLKT